MKPKTTKLLKTTYVLSLLLLVALIAYSPPVQAQTQEETTVWIKEKLETYGGHESSSWQSHLTDVQITPCKISWIKKYSDESYTLSYSFNPSLVETWRYDPLGIEVDAEVIRRVHSESGEVTKANYFTLRNGEINIHERMIKALEHLATFCEEKNEAF